MSHKEINILLCGFFEKEYEKLIGSNQKTPVEFSANNVQGRLIGVLKRNANLKVLSAPFIGSYPNGNKIFSFRAFESHCDIEYIPFNNVWGVRNISRTIALKKRLCKLVKNDNFKIKNIIVYSAHTPFLEAAVTAKKKDSGIRICLIVPDLPQYLNLNKEVSLAYKLAKKYDVKHFYELCKYVDTYMFFAPAMKEMFDTLGKRVIVSEGLLDDDIFEKNEEQKKAVPKEPDKKYIVYTGKTYEKFGVKDLIDAFMILDNPSYRLVLCGSGDVDEYVKKQAENDFRIEAIGQVSPDESRMWQLRADVLINPRSNDEDFVKYSFPSKNLEYLASGSPVVAHFLKGMPEIYRDLMFCINDNGNHIDAIRTAIQNALECHDNFERYNKFKIYAKAHLMASSIAQQIIEG